MEGRGLTAPALFKQTRRRSRIARLILSQVPSIRHLEGRALSTLVFQLLLVAFSLAFPVTLG